MNDETPKVPQTYTVTQLAEILQLKPATIRTNARAGTWPHLRFGERTIRFTEAHLQAILTRSEAAPPQQASVRRRTRRPSL
ncbi:helix-turn-helix domain-containing protein [Arthrobacter sp. 92]|uniref:helix-turn-helix domain-containing protein n=1 Tax=Arthrobacter sp. 92 TaxID=3418175 RepID=UPI003D006708